MLFIKQSDSITAVHMILLAMTAIGLNNHVFVISPLIDTSGRDAWLTVLLTLLPTILWIPLILYIHKKSNRQPLFVWLSNIIGPTLSKVLAILLMCYFIILTSVSLRETVTWTNITFLPTTPPIVLVIVFIFICWMLAGNNLRTISMLNVFLLFFITIFGFFVAIANIQHKQPSLLLPVLEHGYGRVFDGMIYQASGMSEMFFFLLLQHKIETPIRFRHYFIISLILTVLTLGPLVGAIIEFGPTEASIQRFPPYEEWGLVSIGRYIEHVDFLSIYQWLSGVFIRISLFLFMIKEFSVLNSKKRKSRSLLFSAAITIILTLLPITDHRFIALLRTFILPSTFWIFFSLSIFLCIIALIQVIAKRRSTNEL
ncbi:GerAB/ArcD/ProY family transporter [Neobacillus mesonae]|uniref:GerAB/ArcD/ProY family transporter n=1 Tax=Neobacillus mesonae TaxID=1193713 RepID=UPI001F2E22AE|nr:endospore germination permease [Neobacillus mesonae]